MSDINGRLTMSANLNSHLIEDSLGANGGQLWNRLHSEREGICEAIVKEPPAASEANENVIANWHLGLLQARLRKVDDALDRLMSGSFGECCKCGRWIEDTKLAFDPAVAFCVECWEREQRRVDTGPLTKTQSVVKEQASTYKSNDPDTVLSLDSLSPFDTVIMRTRNSEYRILLLDPGTGRALVEGGRLVPPVDAMILGSTRWGEFRCGSIGIGDRLEIWVKDQQVSTSPVQSFRVERRSTESPQSMPVV
jgi:RNA polymerase-binding transcription factor DksA